MGKGASASQNQIEGSQQSFQNTLMNDFGTAFSGQQNIINGLTTSFNKTLAAGPSQFGFSTPETTALNTQATSGVASAYQNARAAAGEAAAASGGSSMLPSGAASQNQAQAAQAAAQSQSNALLGIQEAGYKQGNANYNEAAAGLQGAAGLENPNGLASNANTAGSDAASTASTIQKENAAASPWAQVGGLVGSLGGAAISAFVPMLSATKGMDSQTFGSLMNAGTVADQGAGGGNAGLDLSGVGG